jgi:hypothetical protein
MRDLGRHRVKHHCSLLSLAPITFDANTFSCYGGSYFATIAVIFIICRRPLNLVGPSMPTSSLRYLLPRSLPIIQSMFLCRIVFCLYHHRPRGRCSCLHQHFSHLFSELHNTSMGHAHLVCTQFFIFWHNSQKVGSYRFLFSPTDRSARSHYCSILQQHSQ